MTNNRPGTTRTAQNDSYADYGGKSGMGFWAFGLISFAILMMMALGSFHFIVGLAAVLGDTFYTVRPRFGMEMDTTVWGWIHILLSVLLMVGSLGLVVGARWARMIAIVFAALTILWNFYSVPYYPAWSALMIVVGIGVIWELVAHGDEFNIE
jgi:hypothetical protein